MPEPSGAEEEGLTDKVYSAAYKYIAGASSSIVPNHGWVLGEGRATDPFCWYISLGNVSRPGGRLSEVHGKPAPYLSLYIDQGEIL